jgi:hypothetical protein
MLTELAVTNEREPRKAQSQLYRDLFNWIRPRETPFLSALAAYGLKSGAGFQIFPTTMPDPTQPIYTGKDLCEDASFALYLAATKRFGYQYKIQPVISKVIPLSPATISRDHPEKCKAGQSSEGLDHVWLRFEDQKENDTCDVDGTFGQINLRLNRVAIFETKSEPDFYGVGQSVRVSETYKKSFLTEVYKYQYILRNFPKELTLFRKVVEALI